MKGYIFIVLFVILARGSTYAQTDSLLIEKTGSITLRYQVSEIIGISFSGSEVAGAEDVVKMNEVLKTFALHQNYPNPFNPTTKIAYSIPERGNVQVRIYDVNGKETKILQTGMQESGEHTLTWDSRNAGGTTVTSGVYFYQVQYNNSILTKKMIYLK